MSDFCDTLGAFMGAAGSPRRRVDFSGVFNHPSVFGAAAAPAVPGATPPAPPVPTPGLSSVPTAGDPVNDIVALTRRMEKIKPVTLEVAGALLRTGMAVLAEAARVDAMTHAGVGTPFSNLESLNVPIAILVRQLGAENIPGSGDLIKIADRLAEQGVKLGQITAAQPPPPMTAVYPDGPALKMWVVQAFIALNAKQDGAARMAAYASDMWREIAEGLLKVIQAPGRIVMNVLEGGEKFTKGAGDVLGVLPWVLLGVGGIWALSVATR
jgi:hypothetical protein